MGRGSGFRVGETQGVRLAVAQGSSFRNAPSVMRRVPAFVRQRPGGPPLPAGMASVRRSLSLSFASPGPAPEWRRRESPHPVPSRLDRAPGRPAPSTSKRAWRRPPPPGCRCAPGAAAGSGRGGRAPPARRGRRAARSSCAGPRGERSQRNGSGAFSELVRRGLAAKTRRDRLGARTVCPARVVPAPSSRGQYTLALQGPSDPQPLPPAWGRRRVVPCIRHRAGQ